MNVYLHTLGCKVNVVETDSIAALLASEGYTICERPEEAQVILLNSCTVTASGDSRMRRMLHALREAAPDAVLVLTGCYAQAFPEEAAALPEPDLVTGTGRRSELPSLIRACLQQRERRSAVPSAPETFEMLPVGTDAAHTRAFLKIQDGCDRFCTYCIIPFARGRSRSMPADKLKAQAAELRENGFQEIVLCGINLACYGEKDGRTIADAVRFCAEAGFPRIRLGSLEPDGLTEEVLQALAEIPSLCPQFHISVQSGCDRTLAAMHRRYTCAQFLHLAERIRAAFPGASLTTDLMTGFPGETEEDFAQTMQFCKEAGFAQIHTFRYSPRPGTKAASWPEQIPEAVKKARADRLNALARELHDAWLAGHAGQTAEVLFERERGRGFHLGHAPDYARVAVPVQDGDGDWRNTIRRVQITGRQALSGGEVLLGKVIREPSDEGSDAG
ncbi:MAG: tRNA (N(6)-L-threonylcarbamoyladenosine(37)-C(2))-methylthiotransferase MtaB [Oscillospiraceae bacterium]|nr:tRNA (N(6)-L-threonylcarbamoyladenosine(37)-C(2))-methylthiotransferase MtaB [Oscillospiraceae bacterium]